jgi:hypothetical protein
VESDLSLDCFFMGMNDGTIDIWDIDREISRSTIYWVIYMFDASVPGAGKSWMTPIVAMALHPRILGIC